MGVYGGVRQWHWGREGWVKMTLKHTFPSEDFHDVKVCVFFAELKKTEL